jgi:hypothetical protein
LGLVICEAENPVAWFCRDTCAPTRIAPEESTTSPRKEEAEFWAIITFVEQAKHNITKNSQHQPIVNGCLRFINE